MKKLLIVCGLALLSTGAFAQLGDFRIGAGVGVGTTGIDIDVSATYGEYLGARFGVDIMPKFKIDKNIDLDTKGAQANFDQMTAKANQINTAAGRTVIDLSNPIFNNRLPDRMEVQGKLKNTTWHLLFDVYPFGARSSFHATVGAYFGPSEIISVYNKEDGFLKPVCQWNEAVNNPDPSYAALIAGQKMIQAKLGDYWLAPNPAQNGNVEAYAKVNSFRPYLGIGFGRAVPKKRIGCQFDLGVQFWGKPEVYVPTYNEATGTYQTEKIDADHAGDDAGKVLKTISKISVYPVLNFRLVGRIL